MPKYRRDRINEEMAKELAEILRTVKDPRVSSLLVSVTGAECTPDLKYAKIYISALGEKFDREQLLSGLASASGYIRGQIAERMNLRITPEFKFIFDESLEYGSHISELLRKVEGSLHDDTDSDSK